MNATYGYQYTFTLPALGGTATTSWLTANDNYSYSTAHVTKTTGGDKFDVYYQTEYNGSVTQIGSTLTLRANGHTDNAVWYAPEVSLSNAPYTAYDSSKCTGSNTSTLYCAISGSKYRWTLKNGSILGGTATVISLLSLD